MTEKKPEHLTAQQEAEQALEEGRGPGMTEQEQAQFDRAQEMAEEAIPNPGPDDEPQPQMQAFHAEQTDPPPGPYPDPPAGPYPDPVVKDPPAEDVVYGGTNKRTEEQRRARAAGTTRDDAPKPSR